MIEAVKQAVEVMRKGGIILYPTDTVWGIGCDATNDEAVQKIYKLKGNEEKKSMIVLCHSIDTILRYVSRPPAIALELIEVSDKPLTVIFPGAVGLSPRLIPEEKTVGIRVPNHTFCESLLFRMGRGMVSTSANISGEATPLTFSEIPQAILDGVDYIVEPKWEGKPTRKPSSIIAISESGGVSIIRE